MSCRGHLRLNLSQFAVNGGWHHVLLLFTVSPEDRGKDPQRFRALSVCDPDFTVYHVCSGGTPAVAVKSYILNSTLLHTLSYVTLRLIRSSVKLPSQTFSRILQMCMLVVT